MNVNRKINKPQTAITNYSEILLLPYEGYQKLEQKLLKDFLMLLKTVVINILVNININISLHKIHKA